MPETTSLEHLRGKGMQPGETPLPEEEEQPAAGATAGDAGAGAGGGAMEPDAAIVSQLMAMGFSENGSKVGNDVQVESS
jgi:ubiquitin carboxyl-terminal hydrolase 5/13